MQAAQDGDKAAYETLLTDIVPLLRAVVQRTWRNAHDVDDIVQDVLLSLHAVRDTYDPARPLVPWLLTIARRRIADAAALIKPVGARNDGRGAARNLSRC
jgi:RNA polymerase sigma-70 factor (ECF subfamily)